MTHVRLPCREGFHWDGLSYEHCSVCGLPAWEHPGIAVRPQILWEHPSDKPHVLRPWEPGEAEAVHARWVDRSRRGY